MKKSDKNGNGSKGLRLIKGRNKQKPSIDPCQPVYI